MLRVFVFLCALATGHSMIINYQDCGSTEGVINSLDLSPCEKDPCEFHKGTNYTAHLNFTAKETIKSAKTLVYGIIGGVPVPFQVPPDACQDMKCPVSAGSTEVYTNSIYCDPSYPSIRLVAKWEVKDDDTGKVVFCFLIPVTIGG